MKQEAGPETAPSIGVVIPVRNGSRTIAACLDALLAGQARWRGPMSVVVVDNGSTDDTVGLIRSRYNGRVTVMEDPARTVGALRNLGASLHHTDLLSFVDADCIVAGDYYEVAWNAFRFSGAAAVGAPYALPPRPGWIERTWDVMHQPPAAGPADWLYAGNMVIRAEAFRSVGGFSETLPTGEDPELGRRLRDAGYTLHCDPALVAVHLGNPRTPGAFFRQQWWHGLGAVAPGSLLNNRPLLMTLLHLVLTGTWAALWATGMVRAGLAVVAGLLISQVLVPLITVAFRIWQTRRYVSPLSATVLYWLYYWGRVAALASITLGVPRPPRGRS